MVVDPGFVRVRASGAASSEVAPCVGRAPETAGEVSYS
jgi:hypothetical protein